jgi:predicted nucleic acid-binding protein
MPASTTSVVLDASIAVRAIADERPEALEWFRRIWSQEVDAMWPQLAYAEIANGLATLVRAGRLQADAAGAGLAYALRAPIEPASLDLLAEPALAVALTRSVSVYDAFYIVLAEAAGAALVTADRRLAEAAEVAILI